MDKEFIPYKEALALKELGFDEPCFISNMVGELKDYIGPKESTVPMPLYQQAFRWFREKYGICSWIERLYTDDHVLYYRYTCEKSIESPPNYNKTWVTLKEYNTYEEAEQACLDKLIEIVK